MSLYYSVMYFHPLADPKQCELFFVVFCYTNLTKFFSFQYVWHRMKIYDKVKIPRMNALKRNGTSLEDHVRTYLTPVRASVIWKLRALFKLDFEMFGYDWEEMLRWSGHCPTSGTCALA